MGLTPPGAAASQRHASAQPAATLGGVDGLKIDPFREPRLTAKGYATTERGPRRSKTRAASTSLLAPPDRRKYLYDAAGRRTQTHATTTGLHTELGYDGLGQLASIESYGTGGTVLAASRSYPVYDDAGNRKVMNDGSRHGYLTKFPYSDVEPERSLFILP